MKSALIAGANRGIGLALVKALLRSEDDIRIFALCRKSSGQHSLLALHKNYPSQLQIIDFDPSVESEYHALAETLQPKTTCLDLIINCIGTLHNQEFGLPERKLAEIEFKKFMHAFQVNALPTALLLKTLSPFMRNSARPIFASISAKVGSIGDNAMGGWYSYRASKAALNMIIKTASIEIKRLNPMALVVALHPGTTDTDLAQPFLEHAKKRYQIHTPEETAQNLMNVLKTLDPKADTGKFLNWDGSELPY